ncbi:MAG: PKD domain-containing protein [Mucilaginibacter sp.]
MKKPILKYTPGIILIVFAVYFISCKKIDTFIHVQTPNSSFTVSVNTYYLTLGTTNYIDSNFYFKNLSDSSSTITYQWNFGDGSTSNLKNPKHKYAKRGKYVVSLTTSNKNQASDVAKTTLTVVLGQKTISLGGTVNTQALDVIETADRGFLVLGSTGPASTNTNVFFLMKTDSVYNQLAIKYFSAAFRFNSIQPTTDGNYVLTGTTTGSASLQELIKMTSDGTILWSKAFSGINNVTGAQQTPDGGYLVIGSQGFLNIYNNTVYYTAITKTDATGNTLWSKFFNTGLTISGAMNAVFESDGIVIAGNKSYIPVNNQYCSSCDSLIITKLNNDGSNNWKSTVPWGLNYAGNGAKISKAGNGNYNVIPNNITNGVYFFSPLGAFLDRKLVSASCAFNSTTSDGDIMILQSSYNNGPRSVISKLDLQGFTLWTKYFNTQQDEPAAEHALKNGGNIFIGNQQAYMLNSYSYYTSIVLLQLAEDGSVM